MLKRRACRLVLLLSCLIVLLVIYLEISLQCSLASDESLLARICCSFLNPASLGQSRTSSDEPRIPLVSVDEIDCSLLFLDDAEELKRAVATQNITDDSVELLKLFRTARANPVSYCRRFLEWRRYVDRPLSTVEAEFPIAYSILVFKNPWQFERLLRAVYHPQNSYCVHVDKSSGAGVHQIIRIIVDCFPNVFIPSVVVDVDRGELTVLEAEMLCMEELLKFNKTWRYFINLTGQEFPLKTNRELVEILTTFNGSNNIDGTLENRDESRYVDAPLTVPYNATVTKGSVHIVATRQFIEYATGDLRALTLLRWVRRTFCPDETYFSTLNHNPQLGVPGAYLGRPESNTGDYRFVARFKNWMGDLPCDGMYINYICIFGVGDLARLASRKELFANKFYADYQPLSYACMEEWLYNRTKSQAMMQSYNDVINISYYRTLSHVHNHVIV